MEINLACGVAGFVIGWVLHTSSVPVPPPWHCVCKCIQQSPSGLWLLVSFVVIGLLAGAAVVLRTSTVVDHLASPNKGRKGVFGGVGNTLA